MSAFLCSDRHLAAIVRAWTETKYAIGLTMAPGVHLDRTNADDWQRFADALYLTNVASVNYRYPGDADTDAAPPRFNHGRAPVVTGLALVKLLDCYDYQACEVPGYEESHVAKAIDAIRKMTIQSLPGWQDAKWAI